MAIAPVTYIAPQDTVTSSKGRQGGGKFGQLGGAVAGAVIGGLAAGPGGAAVGALGGAGSGAAVGGLLGEQVLPTVAGSQAVERRLQTSAPQLVHSDASQTLRDSILALHEAPPAIQQQYAEPLTHAYIQSLANDNVGQGVA